MADRYPDPDSFFETFGWIIIGVVLSAVFIAGFLVGKVL